MNISVRKLTYWNTKKEKKGERWVELELLPRIFVYVTEWPRKKLVIGLGWLMFIIEFWFTEEGE